MTAVDPLLTDALRDRYAIERELGRGGMATVYLAEDLRHHRQVAIKVLRPELAATLGPERFLREIQIAARLRHPHIVPLYDSGEADGLLYYVMPYVEGESLRDRLRRERQLPVNEALGIAREVADALAHAHERELIHRDIKPENILLEGGHALVADFGIARAVGSAATKDLTTATGLAIGTPAYMSPEQALGDTAVDARSDVYALGCVLYEMLAGEPPYTGPTPQAIMARRLSEPVRSLRTVRDTVPEQLEQAVMRALARVPADRFPSVTAFRDALVGGPGAPDRSNRAEAQSGSADHATPNHDCHGRRRGGDAGGGRGRAAADRAPARWGSTCHSHRGARRRRPAVPNHGRRSGAVARGDRGHALLQSRGDRTAAKNRSRDRPHGMAADGRERLQRADGG